MKSGILFWCAGCLFWGLVGGCADEVAKVFDGGASPEVPANAECRTGMITAASNLPNPRIADGIDTALRNSGFSDAQRELGITFGFVVFVYEPTPRLIHAVGDEPTAALNEGFYGERMATLVGVPSDTYNETIYHQTVGQGDNRTYCHQPCGAVLSEGTAPADSSTLSVGEAAPGNPPSFRFGGVRYQPTGSNQFYQFNDQQGAFADADYAQDEAFLESAGGVTPGDNDVMCVSACVQAFFHQNCVENGSTIGAKWFATQMVSRTYVHHGPVQIAGVQDSLPGWTEVQIGSAGIDNDVAQHVINRAPWQP